MDAVIDFENVYQVKQQCYIIKIGRIGCNVETVEYKDISFTMSDVGRQENSSNIQTLFQRTMKSLCIIRLL